MITMMGMGFHAPYVSTRGGSSVGEVGRKALFMSPFGERTFIVPDFWMQLYSIKSQYQVI